MKRNSYLLIAALCWIAILAIVMQGCAFSHPYGSPGSVYDEKFREWQERQQREGWTAGLVSDVISGCQYVGEYEAEKQDGVTDHWKTYGEFVKDNYTGDCEDFAFFEAGTLKRLGYPHRIWVLIVRMMLGDHVKIEIEMPDGSHEFFDGTGDYYPIVAGMLDPVCFLNYIAWPVRLVGRYEIGP